jgi:hypothetical protein
MIWRTQMQARFKALVPRNLDPGPHLKFPTWAMIGIANADLPLLFNAQVLENLKNVLVLLMSMVHKVN